MLSQIRISILLLAVLALVGTPVFAQSQTQDGHPDLNGVWDFRTVTPLERPSEFSDKEFLTEEEAAAYAEARVIAQNADLNREEKKTVTTSRGLSLIHI